MIVEVEVEVIVEVEVVVVVHQEVVGVGEEHPEAVEVALVPKEEPKL